MTIGIIDTGIDYTHADFGGPGTVDAYNAALAHSAAAPTYPDTDKVAGGYDFAGDSYNADPQADAFQPIPHPDTNPLDCAGHGSHVAGTAAGYGEASDGSTFHGPYNASTPFGTLKIGPGMAPGATLYALKVFGCDGSTDVVSSALDWAADPNGDGDVSDHLDVVNMSLGSDFASPEDPDAVATNNAVLAGITVAASMGNSGDAFEVGGSPGSASRAIAVAASDDNTDQVDGVGVKIDGADAPGSPYPGELSIAYDWTNKPGLTDAPLAEIASTWTDGAVAGNNADGCAPLTPAQAALVAGKVAFLYWTDNDINRRCGSVGRSANVKAAGAIGALFGNDSNRFSAGITGDDTIPVMITSAGARDDIQGALNASKAVTVTLTGALRLAVKNVLTGADDPTDAIVGFSSRGITQAGNVKPDVSAPGNSIVSVGMGTGASGAVESGTSMASPHVAGEAALVIAAHPDWRPEQVKAAIMNTANHHVYPGPAHTGAPLGVLRAGAGRIDAESAVGTDSLAYVVNDPGVVSVSFGDLDVTGSTLTRTKQVRVENDSAGSKTYALSVDDVDTLPGADFAVSPTSVTLPGNTSREVTVTFTATRSALNHKPDPSLELDPLGIGLDRDWASYATARLVVTPTSGDELTVPLYASPRVASTMHAAAAPTLSGSGTTAAGTLTLAGTGVHQGTGAAGQDSSVSAFELQGISPRLPGCGSAGSISLLIGCIPYEDTRSADLKYVGVSSDAPAVKTGGGDPYGAPIPANASFLYFGITAYAPWRTAAGLQEYDVLIDTDGDFEPDLVVYNDRLTTPAGDPLDVFVATTVSLRDGDDFAVIDQELLNQAPGQFDTRKIGSDSLVLPVELNLLAHPTDADGNPLKPFMSSKSPRFQYSVESINGEIGLTDVAGEEDIASLLDPDAPFVAAVLLRPDQAGPLGDGRWRPRPRRRLARFDPGRVPQPEHGRSRRWSRAPAHPSPQRQRLSWRGGRREHGGDDHVADAQPDDRRVLEHQDGHRDRHQHHQRDQAQRWHGDVQGRDQGRGDRHAGQRQGHGRAAGSAVQGRRRLHRPRHSPHHCDLRADGHSGWEHVELEDAHREEVDADGQADRQPDQGEPHGARQGHGHLDHRRQQPPPDRVGADLGRQQAARDAHARQRQGHRHTAGTQGRYALAEGEVPR